jgi:Tfp pilus assembly protein PilZ
VNYTRRHQRFRLDSVEVSGQMTFASEVSVLDIGMGGVSLRADKRLNIGGTYMLKLESRSKAVTVVCQVAWARMSGTKKSADGGTVPLYTAGMKFLDLTEDRASDLLRLVECVRNEEMVPMSDRRMHVRFQIGAPGTARLVFPTDYRVRTISLSGMLIESDESLPTESLVPMVLALQEDRSIEFLGRVVSCQPKSEDDRNKYHIGIEFIDVAGDARIELSTFIEVLSTSGRV